MYCKKCKQKLSDGDKFCMKCGEKVIQNTSESNKFGNTVKNKILNIWNKCDLFSKITIGFISVSLLLCLLAFIFGNFVAGVIAIVEISLFIIAWLMKKKRIKTQHKWLPFLLIGLACILIVPYFRSCDISSTKSYDNNNYSAYSTEAPTTEANKKLEWPDHPLTKLVPVPKSEFGYIEWELDDDISIVVEKTTEQDYKDYIKKCEENGFTAESSTEGSFYYAKNAEGYRICLYYDNEANSMTIKIQEPLLLVDIEIECTENLLFSRYDVIVDVGLKEIGTLKHGGKETYQLELEKGTHTLNFQKKDDISVNNEVDFEVTKNDELFRYKISCESDTIQIEDVTNIIETTVPVETTDGKIIMTKNSTDYIGEDYLDVEPELKELGFTDIQLNEVDTFDEYKFDGEVFSVLIGSDLFSEGEFSKNDKFDPEETVIINYYVVKEKPTEKEETIVNNQNSEVSNNPVSSGTGDRLVWIPETGSKYHTHSGCSNMINPSQVTISEAENRGFTPCKRCH